MCSGACMQLIKALKCWRFCDGVKVYCWQTPLSRPYTRQLLLLATEQHDRLCIRKCVLHSTSRWEIHLLSIWKRLVECIMRYFTRSMHRWWCCLVGSNKFYKQGKAVYMYVLNKLHWLIQIPQSKQYYHMGLSMSKFGYFTIIACSYMSTVCRADGS